ncbi:RDD family protein [Candidatus Microgenomates bacterium]|nr:RDD family protein [Candidatus Microgenomates bacterium]
MNCPKCNQPNSPSSQFCISCGSPLVVPAPTPAPTQQGPVPTPLQTPAPTVAVSTIYAGFWKRFAAFLLDNIIGAAVGGVMGLVIGLAVGGSTKTADILINILSVIVAWLYFALMESSSNQATIGKMALGIKVTDVNGNRISFARATGRYFAKIISTLILLIGYIMTAFTQKKQALHDIIAGTLVVKK